MSAFNSRTIRTKSSKFHLQISKVFLKHIQLTNILNLLILQIINKVFNYLVLLYLFTFLQCMEIRSRHRNAGTVDVVFRRTPAFWAKLVKTPGIYRFWVDFRRGQEGRHSTTMSCYCFCSLLLLLLLLCNCCRLLLVLLLLRVVVAWVNFAAKQNFCRLRKSIEKTAVRRAGRQPSSPYLLRPFAHTHTPTTLTHTQNTPH